MPLQERHDLCCAFNMEEKKLSYGGIACLKARSTETPMNDVRIDVKFKKVGCL